MHIFRTQNSQNMSWLQRWHSCTMLLSVVFMALVIFPVHALPIEKPALDPVKPLIHDDIEGTKVQRHKADSAAGAKSAQKFCANCHIFKGHLPEQTGEVGIPSFSDIADKKGQTIDKLTRFLFVPHGSMPDMHLTRNEIADLTAFIMSHQTKPAPKTNKTKEGDPHKKYPAKFPKKS